MELIDRNELWNKVYSNEFGWSNEDVVAELKCAPVVDITPLITENEKLRELLGVFALDAKKWNICATCVEFYRNKCKRGFVMAASNRAGCRCWQWKYSDDLKDLLGII